MSLAVVFSVELQRDTKKRRDSCSCQGKINSFAGQPVVFWERKNGDQCFGEEKESDDRGGTSENRIITVEAGK